MADLLWKPHTHSRWTFGSSVAGPYFEAVKTTYWLIVRVYDYGYFSGSPTTLQVLVEECDREGVLNVAEKIIAEECPESYLKAVVLKTEGAL